MNQRYGTALFVGAIIVLGAFSCASRPVTPAGNGGQTSTTTPIEAPRLPYDPNDPEKIVNVNGEIFYRGAYRGKVQGDTLTVVLSGNTTLSFPGDVKKLAFMPFFADPASLTDKRNGFAYEDLVFSNQFWVGMGPKLPGPRRFDCKAPLAPTDPFYYCQANSARVSMYQITDYNPFGLGTGGGSTFQWKLAGEFQTEGQRVFFSGDLTKDPSSYYFSDDLDEIRFLKDTNPPPDAQRLLSLQEKIATNKKKETLDKLLAMPDVAEKVARWEKLVDSVKIIQN